MPLYDYQCDECGHLFEVLRKRTDPDPEACPQCSAAGPRRAISATSFQLKGSGWYVTDYKGANPAVAAGSSAGDAASSSGDSTSGDSSTAASGTSDAASSEPAPAKTTEAKSSSGEVA